MITSSSEPTFASTVLMRPESTLIGFGDFAPLEYDQAGAYRVLLGAIYISHTYVDGTVVMHRFDMHIPDADQACVQNLGTYRIRAHDSGFLELSIIVSACRAAKITRLDIPSLQGSKLRMVTLCK
jgi:hypothetical protein